MQSNSFLQFIAVNVHNGWQSGSSVLKLNDEAEEEEEEDERESSYK